MRSTSCWPASMSPSVQTCIAQGLAPLGVSKLVLTRLDDIVGLGVILNVVERLHLGLSYLTAGQNVPSDLQEASGERVADQLCAADASERGTGVLQA